MRSSIQYFRFYHGVVIGNYQWSPVIRWEACWWAYDCWACVRFLLRPNRLAWRWWTVSWGTCPLFPLGTHPALQQTRFPGPEIWPHPVVYYYRYVAAVADDDDDSGDRWLSYGCYRLPPVPRIHPVPVGRPVMSPADRSTGPCPVSCRSSCIDVDIFSPIPVAHHIHTHAHTNYEINSRVNDAHKTYFSDSGIKNRIKCYNTVCFGGDIIQIFRGISIYR